MLRFEGRPGDLNAPVNSWGVGEHTTFRLRGKGYMQDRVKVVPGELSVVNAMHLGGLINSGLARWLENERADAEPVSRTQFFRRLRGQGLLTTSRVGNYTPADSLYQMVGMDTFATEARVGNMASEVDLTSVSQNLPKVAVPGVPPLLILNVQLPSASPALMSSAEDGPGYQDATVRALENMETSSEALKLWVAYCQHLGVDDEYHGRFKCIAVIENFDSLGLPGFVTKYNGKPVLINRSGKWVRGENYIENTINVHRFSFIAKKSLHSLKSIFNDMVLHLGFTIEGRSPEELPESILACSTLYYPRLDTAVEFDI